MKEAELVALGRALGPVLVKLVERETAGLRVRVASLEGRPPESWQATRGYSAGAAVTAPDGTLWIANRDCSGEKPGAGDSWRLA